MMTIKIDNSLITQDNIKIPSNNLGYG